MGCDVFLSHSSADKHFADAAVAFLEQRGIRCWVAPRDILPGESWARSILRAVEASRMMIVILSSNANKSNHVRREVELAVNAGTVVVPVRVEDVLPADELKYFLNSAHWLDAVTPPLERHLQLLAEKVARILALDAPPPSDDRDSGQEPAADPELLKSQPPPQSLLPDQRKSDPKPAPPRASGGSRFHPVLRWATGLATAAAICYLAFVRPPDPDDESPVNPPRPGTDRNSVVPAGPEPPHPLETGSQVERLRALKDTMRSLWNVLRDDINESRKAAGEQYKADLASVLKACTESKDIAGEFAATQELKRFAASGTPPDVLDFSENPRDVRDVQTGFRERILAISGQVQNFRLIYMGELSSLEKSFAAENNEAGAQLVRVEKEKAERSQDFSEIFGKAE